LESIITLSSSSGDTPLLAKKVKILSPQRHLALVYFDVGRLNGDYPGGKGKIHAISIVLYYNSVFVYAEISPMSKLYRCAIESYQYLLIWNREESTNHMGDIDPDKGWRGGISYKESPKRKIYLTRNFSLL